MARFELVGQAPEVEGERARLHLYVCASTPNGRPIGEFHEVAVSPWFSVCDESAAMLWFYDWYRDRQGFRHPEDPRGGASSPGVGVVVANLVTGEARVHCARPRDGVH